MSAFGVMQHPRDECGTSVHPNTAHQSLITNAFNGCVSFKKPFFLKKGNGEKKVKVCQISQKLKNNGNRFNALNTNFKYLVHQYGLSYFNPP